MFTAGYDWYADPIIDQIDPTGTLIQHRFYRHHSRKVFNQENQPLFIKDLGIFAGLDLRKVLFVDNHIFSFALNLKNGVPVIDFLGDQQDNELLKVASYADKLSRETQNLMRTNEQVFGL